MSDVARILKEARDQGRLTALDFAQAIVTLVNLIRRAIVRLFAL